MSSHTNPPHTPQPAAAIVHTLANLPADSPMPLIERRRIIGEQAMLSSVTLFKGFKLKSHRHANEQFAVVLAGRVVFGLNEPGTPGYHEVTLTAGQVLQLPSNVWHSAEALEETRILDIFAPPSEKTGIDRA